jgi:hypothetical protein
VRDPFLIFDRKEELGATPGLHAVIIGVSEYSFLPGEDDIPGDGLTALKKLQSSALSGWLVAEKIKQLDAEKRLIRPLKTVRLLLAPSEKEKAAFPMIDAAGGQAPTCSNINDALWNWRDDVGASKDDQALFFYSGHGIRRLREETILLAVDFLQPRRKNLENAFDFRNIFNGMVPSSEFPNIGREQFYFIDACRDKPDKLDQLESTDSHEVFDAVLGSLDDRRAPKYYPTVTGGSAAGIPGRPTFFTEALLWSLDNAAHDKVQLDGVDGQVWPVTAESLKDGFEAANPMFKDRVVLGEIAGDPMLCFGHEAPRLKFTLALRPEAVQDKIAKIHICDPRGKIVSEIIRAAATDPWEREVTAGMYMVRVKGKKGTFPVYNSELAFVRLGLPMPHGITIGGVS